MHDLKIAFRTLSRHRATAVATILTIALGIGACTAIFSVIEGVLLRPLPYPDTDRIVQVWQVGRRGGRMQTSDPNFEEWRDRSINFEVMAQFRSQITSVIGGKEPVRVRVGSVSQGFFQALGVRPVIGRRFGPEEQKFGAEPTAIVSQGFWERHLDGATDLSGRQLTFANRVHSIIGVMPSEFSFPPGTEVWTPRELLSRNPNRTGHNWRALAKISDNVSLEQAQAEISAIGQWQLSQFSDDIWLTDVELVPLHEQLVGNVRPQLMLLLGAVVFMLLVACANAGNLLIAQAHVRSREMAVRSALGASASRLVRQFLAETLTLAGLGCLLGIALAFIGIEALLALNPGNLPRVEDIGINRTVLIFALALTLTTAAALSLFPLLAVARRNLGNALRDGARGQSGGVRQQRARSVLVVGEVALTIVLLVGASLLIRSFLRVLEVDPGFRVGNALTFDLSQSSPQNPAEERRLATFLDDLINELKALPSVTEVGGVNSLPLGGGYANGRFLVAAPGYDISDITQITPEFIETLRQLGNVGSAHFRVASEGYFPAMDIPLIRGRLPNPGDDGNAPQVAVISQSLAQTQWPDDDPLGKQIQWGNMDGDPGLITVVGIVGDVLDDLEGQSRPTIYINARQRPRRSAAFTIVVRAQLPPDRLAGQVRATVRRLNPNLPVRMRSMDQIFSSTLAPRRFTLLLVGVFAACSLLVAAIGLFGVISHSVSRRTREFGVRFALGAVPFQVSRLVIRQGLTLGVAGLALGIVIAMVLTRSIQNQLFGITSTDPIAYLVIVPIVLAVVVLACYLPARKAARVSPLDALRVD